MSEKVSVTIVAVSSLLNVDVSERERSSVREPSESVCVGVTVRETLELSESDRVAALETLSETEKVDVPLRDLLPSWVSEVEKVCVAEPDGEALTVREAGPAEIVEVSEGEADHSLVNVKGERDVVTVAERESD